MLKKSTHLVFRHPEKITVFLVSFAVYYLTLCPVIYVGDSGELVAAALSMGIAHPPGYPLYVILGKIFSLLIPLSASAFEMNLFSAWWGACAAVMLCSLLRIMGLGRIIAAACALVFAFLNPFWSQAVVARVYTLNACIMLAALVCIFDYTIRERRSSLVWYFFFLGLGLANHPITIITVPVFVVMTISKQAFRREYALSMIIKYLLALLPGAALYLYLPLRAATHPAINWGNPGKAKGLMAFILRKEYWNRRYVENIGDAVEVIVHYLSLVPREYLFVGTVFILLGIYALGCISKRMVIAIVLYYILNIYFMIVHGSRSDIYFWPRYVIPSFMSVTILLAFGMHAVVRDLRRPWLAWGALVFPVVMLTANYARNDRSENYLADEINRMILDNLPQNATLVAQGDNILFPITYFHYIKGMRPDMKLFELGMNELPPFEFNPRTDPTFFTHYNDFGIADLRFVPYGLVYQVATPDMLVPHFEDWSQFELTNLTAKPVYFDYLCRCLAGDYYFMIAANLHRKSFEDALPFYLKAVEMAYDNDVIHYNLGLVFEREGYYKEAIEQFKRVRQIDKKNENALRHIEADTQQLDQIRRQYLSDRYDANKLDDAFAQDMANMERFFRKGDIVAAQKYAKRALDANPAMPDIWANYGTLFLLEGDVSAAIDAYSTALHYDPSSQAAKANLEQLRGFRQQLKQLGFPEDYSSLSESESDELFRRATEQSKQKYEKKDIYEAIFYQRIAARIRPESADVHKNLGALYLALKLLPLAYSEYRTALRYEPQNEELHQNCMKINRMIVHANPQ